MFATVGRFIYSAVYGYTTIGSCDPNAKDYIIASKIEPTDCYVADTHVII